MYSKSDVARESGTISRDDDDGLWCVDTGCTQVGLSFRRSIHDPSFRDKLIA